MGVYTYLHPTGSKAKYPFAKWHGEHFTAQKEKSLSILPVACAVGYASLFLCSSTYGTTTVLLDTVRTHSARHLGWP